MTLDPWHVFTTSFGHFALPYTAFVTLLDVILYQAIGFNVGRARVKHNILAPFMDGPEDFLRVMRVHMNMTEQMVYHLPILWIAAFAMSDVFAAAFGIVWTLGRILYARGYYQKAKRRHKGFMICFFVDIILLIGAFAGVVASF